MPKYSFGQYWAAGAVFMLILAALIFCVVKLFAVITIDPWAGVQAVGILAGAVLVPCGVGFLVLKGFNLVDP